MGSFFFLIAECWPRKSHTLVQFSCFMTMEAPSNPNRDDNYKEAPGNGTRGRLSLAWSVPSKMRPAVQRRLWHYQGHPRWFPVELLRRTFVGIAQSLSFAAGRLIAARSWSWSQSTLWSLRSSLMATIKWRCAETYECLCRQVLDPTTLQKPIHGKLHLCI